MTYGLGLRSGALVRGGTPAEVGNYPAGSVTALRGRRRQRRAPAGEPVSCLQRGQAQGRRRLTIDLRPGLSRWPPGLLQTCRGHRGLQPRPAPSEVTLLAPSSRQRQRQRAPPQRPCTRVESSKVPLFTFRPTTKALDPEPKAGAKAKRGSSPPGQAAARPRLVLATRLPLAMWRAARGAEAPSTQR